jgi:hypothetical protein
MSNGNGNFQVNQVTIRTAPRLDAQNRPTTSTVVSFFVGAQGPFSVVYGQGQATAQQIITDITAKVNEVKGLFTAVNQLNQQV